MIGIIARSALKLTRLTLGRRPLLWTIAATLTISTAWTEREILWLFLAAGLLPVLPLLRPRTAVAAGLPLFLPALATPAAPSLGALLWFFTKAGAFVFGSGLAIVPFLYGGVVREHGWLTDPALVQVGEVVNDIDLKDGKYGRPETQGLRQILEGLYRTQADDEERLRQGFTFFDALHESLRRPAKVREER